MAVGIDGGTDAGAFINVTGLGEELDVERHSLWLDGCLGVGVTYLALTGEWIEPLPLLGVGAKISVTLSGSILHLYMVAFPCVKSAQGCLTHAEYLALFVLL